MLPRVLHCPATLAGHPFNLARAERALGLQSWCVSLFGNRLKFPCDEILCDHAGPACEWSRWKLVLRAIREFDVVHYNFGSTLLQLHAPADPYPRVRGWKGRLFELYKRVSDMLDARLFRMLGKRLVVTYQGDDARQGAYLRQSFRVHPADEAGPDYYTDQGDARKRACIRLMDRCAHRIYALNPDLLHVLPKRARFLPYAIEPLERAPQATGRPLVLHAPTHRGVKGTRFVLEAFRQLQAEGVEFDFRLVENLPHHEAVQLYRDAALLVDQLLVGWYGGLAVELMYLARPVLAYIRPDDLHFLPPAMRAELPVIQATPHTLTDVLRHWLTCSPEQRARVGEASRAFALRWHHPESVARRMEYAP